MSFSFEFLTQAWFELGGIPINGLVLIYLVLAVVYSVFKFKKGFLPLKAAEKILQAFKHHLDGFDPQRSNTTLQQHVADYFVQLEEKTKAQPTHKNLEHA
jgi:hypothetical protein